jgi:[ribosomal protein S5]-alanine N-acetyltransferase
MMKFVVRELLREDLDAIYTFMINKEIAYLTDHDPTITYEEFVDKYELYLDGHALDLKIFVIELDGLVIGKMELGYDMMNKTGIFDIIIGNKMLWGRGIAKKALKVLFSYGFKDLRLNKISCEVFRFNESSIGLMKKMNMSIDGILRQEQWVHGQFVDVFIFSILKSEFIGG